MKEPVSLKPFQPSHLLSLTRWLASPAVARWYPDPESEIKWASQPPNGGTHAVIAVAAHELGYIRWQRVDRDTLDSVGMPEVPDNSVDVDILIGEEAFRGKGVGTAAILRLIDRLRLEADVPLVGLSPEAENAVAIRSYEKAGFRFRRNYSVEGDDRVYSLMTLPLQAETR